jgi:hypothetical protein
VEPISTHPNDVQVTRWFETASDQAREMDDYFYRIDPPQMFNRSQAGILRMPAWNGRFNQSQLGPIKAKLRQDEELFRLSFFDIFSDACYWAWAYKNSQPRFVFSRISRVHLAGDNLISVGRESGWLGPRDGAVLFAVVETRTLENQRWSSFGIPLALMERLDQVGNWGSYAVEAC